MRQPRLTLLVCAAASVALFGGVPAASSAAAAAKPKVKCKAGTVPKVTGSGTRAKLVKRKGKVVCVAPPKVKATQIEPAAATQQGTISSTADGLTQALMVNPAALAAVERKIGKKATKALLDRGMNGWRAGARAQARRLADDGFHYSGTFGDAAKGTAGSAKLDAGPAGDGGSGLKASATIEFSADTKGLKDLGADKITSAKNAKLRLEIAFEDAPAACPTAAGKVKGTISASAKLTIDVDGTTTTMSAKVDGTYNLTVGGDAHWKTIDDVNIKTEFQFGGNKQGSTTWRGERGGSGFGQRGVFGEGSGDFVEAITEQQSHVNPNVGGVWGPKGRVLFSDPSTDNVFNYGGSLDHLKGMVVTDLATTYLMYAAVEYLRHVVGPRGDKHWHDAEACLKLTGTPDKAKLGPGETAVVTVKDAKAADGTPVGVSLTGTGVASLTPGSASMAPAGSTPFTLTAPTARPVKATWQVVALSPAGKKTVSGSLEDQPTYTVILDDHEVATYATWTSRADVSGKADTKAVEGSNPFQSKGTGPLTWSNFSNTMNIDYSTMHDPVPGPGEFTPTVTSNADGTVNVAIDVSALAKVLWTVTVDEPYDIGCDCDPAPVDTPNSAGTITIALWSDPINFTLPSTGGTHSFNKQFTTGDGGTTSTGTVTLIPGTGG